MGLLPVSDPIHASAVAPIVVGPHDGRDWWVGDSGEVEETNNVAERALRTTVQWRKIMFGTRSDQGERAVEPL